MTENFPPVLEFNFRNDLHVMAYFYYLMAEDLQYHFDDNPMEIDWQTRIVSMDDMGKLEVNHITLWAYCNPWEWMEKHPQIWEMWQDSQGYRESGNVDDTSIKGMYYVRGVGLHNTGGGCMVDTVKLEGYYIGITDECIAVHKGEPDDNSDDFLEDPIGHIWLK